jgi:hypothetical protein
VCLRSDSSPLDLLGSLGLTHTLFDVCGDSLAPQLELLLHHILLRRIAAPGPATAEVSLKSKCTHVALYCTGCVTCIWWRSPLEFVTSREHVSTPCSEMAMSLTVDKPWLGEAGSCICSRT